MPLYTHSQLQRRLQRKLCQKLCQNLCQKLCHSLRKIAAKIVSEVVSEIVAEVVSEFVSEVVSPRGGRCAGLSWCLVDSKRHIKHTTESIIAAHCPAIYKEIMSFCSSKNHSRPIRLQKQHVEIVDRLQRRLGANLSPL